MPRKTFNRPTEAQGSPAESYITKTEAGEPKKEIKSRRTQLMLRPSAYKHMRMIADMRRTSVNEVINTALEDYAAAHMDEVERYKATWGDG